MASQTVLSYSGTTTINKVACDNLTGDYVGIAVQGAGSWHIYHTNSKGVLQGKGYYNANSGGRHFGLIDLKAGDIVHITASGGLPTSATNGTYDSENSTAGTDCYYTVTANGHFDVSVTRYFYIHTVSVTRDLADLEAPTYDITGANGVERQVTLSCITDGAAIKYNTVNDKSAPGWTTYSAPFYTSEATLYAYSEKSSSTSDVVTITTGAGTAITLNAPTISGTFELNGLAYNPRYTFSSNQSGKVIGNPILTYTYSFNSGASTEGTSYSPSSSGSLTVTVSAEGYTSNSTTQDVFGGNFAMTYFFDAINDVTVETGSGTWTNPSNIGGAQWTFTGLENSTYTLRGDMSLTGFMYARTTTKQTKEGFYTRVSAGSIDFTLEDGEAIVFTTLGDNIIANSSSTSQAIAQYTNIRTITIYSPATEVDLAIFDCMQFEENADFANAAAAESFSTAAEVYAFYTAWHIAKADAASSNDITKVIRNAAVADGTDWNDARRNSGQQYTGAPDNTYFDAWDQYVSNASQTIYGLPAGTYTLKVATRASETLTDINKYNVWVNGGTADARVLGHHEGSEGNFLGNGWNWTVITFTLDAAADVNIGFYSLPGKSSNLWAGCDDWHLYKGILTHPVSISELGWATLYTPYALNFDGTGLTAYTATVAGSTITLNPVTEVPANTGVVLNGDEGSYNIPVITSSTEEQGALTGNAAAATAYDAFDGYTLYALAQAEDYPTHQVQFRPVESGSIAAGKAFLKIANGSLVKAFDIDIAGADAIDDVRSKMEEGRSEIFNLAGQRMNRLQKGVNIVNGKKILVK